MFELPSVVCLDIALEIQLFVIVFVAKMKAVPNHYSSNFLRLLVKPSFFQQSQFWLSECFAEDWYWKVEGSLIFSFSFFIRVYTVRTEKINWE